MKTLIILGSSRRDGNTAKIVKQLIALSDWDKIDLNDYNFSYYDYEHKNRNDDFLDLMRSIIQNYDVLIFATPVYWYSMSGIMKVFLDRITDLLTIEKDLGRQLRGKYMAAVSSSGGNDLGDHFWLPFSETAGYLGMTYLGNLRVESDVDEPLKMKDFVEQVNHKMAP